MSDDLARSRGQTESFALEFLQMVAKWNQLETQARDLLKALLGGQHGHFVVSHHLGNVTLIDTLRTVAETSPVGDEIRHFASGMDRIRLYRNYYVHGLIGVGIIEKSKDAGSVGILTSTQVKSGVKHYEEEVPLAKIRQVANVEDIFRDYGEMITAFVTQPSAARLASLREKPALPEPLTKRLRNL